MKTTHEYTAKFYICSNSETVSGTPSGNPCGRYEEEACDEAVSDAGRVLSDAGFEYECDSFFRNWHGGKHCQFADLHGLVAGYLKVRVTEFDEDGCPETSEWESCDKEDVPADELARIEAAQEAAERAMSVACEKWSALDDAETAAYEAELAAELAASEDDEE